MQIAGKIDKSGKLIEIRFRGEKFENDIIAKGCGILTDKYFEFDCSDSCFLFLINYLYSEFANHPLCTKWRDDEFENKMKDELGKEDG